MPGRKNFDAQLAALEELRELPVEACVAPLRAALKQQNNYIVAKAAALVEQHQVNELLPDLLVAFDRFFEDAEKRDPQCWAKNSLSRTLAALELQEPAPFLRGIKHVQLEAVWGGRSDTAGTLRGTCALALVQCRTVSEADLLGYLLDVLVDKDKSARGDAVRAVEQVGSPTASLLLRLRAQIGGDEDPEILGACYAGVLRIDGSSALSWVSRFLAEENDAAGEAALAMAATHSVEAFEMLKARWEIARDPWFRSVLLSAMALTRQGVATEFLLDLVKSEVIGAELVVEAVLRSLPSEEVLRRRKHWLRETRGWSEYLPRTLLCNGKFDGNRSIDTMARRRILTYDRSKGNDRLGLLDGGGTCDVWHRRLYILDRRKFQAGVGDSQRGLRKYLSGEVGHDHATACVEGRSGDEQAYTGALNTSGIGWRILCDDRTCRRVGIGHLCRGPEFEADATDLEGCKPLV
jgi:hypothetical protein